MSSPWDHLVLTVSAAWKVLFAAAVYYSMPLDLSSAAMLAPQWMLAIVVRNVAITWVTGGVWDWLHLSQYSPLYALLQPVKFSPAPPRRGQLPHDAFWATSSAIIAAGWEIVIAWGWATGRLTLGAVPGDAWWSDPRTLVMLVTLPYAQIIHFYIVHRVMHNWFPRGKRSANALVPDIGALLYKYVHSLHHKSRDPTAFSGISMHPIEAALFFTTMPLYALFGAHPIVICHAALYNIIGEYLI